MTRAAASQQERSRGAVLVLVRPSKYDDEGYVIRHRRSVLPSNSLSCLRTLSEDVARELGAAVGPIEILTVDDSVRGLPMRRLRRWGADPLRPLIVGLVGVQTSQFPRAADLAMQLRRVGARVLVGGFHVAGALGLDGGTTPELDALLDQEVTLVAGEVEAAWARILREACAGELAPVYDLRAAKPELHEAPVPELDPDHIRSFAHQSLATIDTSRGCPFKCSFCTIINVQGRTMRSRDPDAIVETIRRNHHRTGVREYFFTDDNFARNPNWQSILEGLIGLREREGIELRFLMQADLVAHRLPDFVSLAKRAGCFQVFLGMESLDGEALRTAGKTQNRVSQYADVIQCWRDAGILTHGGYIVGFPMDTAASIRRNVLALRDEIGVDIASFFMLTPLPGSKDYADHVASGTPLDEDLSRFDTFHPVVDHPRMTREEWSGVYREAWATFYTSDHMRRQVASAPRELRNTLLQVYIWYCAAIEVERFHPMMTGFFRLKPRLERPNGMRPESLLRHSWRRAPEVVREAIGYAGVLSELRNVWSGANSSAGQPTSWSEFLHQTFGPLAAPRSNAQPPVQRTG